MKLKQKITDYKFLFALCNTLDCVFQYKYIDFLMKYNLYKLCVNAVYLQRSMQADAVVVFIHFLDKQAFIDLYNRYNHVYVICGKRNSYIDCYQHVVLASDFRNVNTERNELMLLHDVYAMLRTSSKIAFMMSNKTYTYVDNLSKYRVVGNTNFMYLVLSMFMYKFLSRIMLTTFSNYKNAKEDISCDLKKMHRIYKYIKYSKC